MTVDVFVRHATDCSHKEDRYWKRCKCRKWLYITGSRKPISAKTRSWDEAVKQARKIEDAQANSTSTGGGGTPPSHSVSNITTVREAVTAFLEDKEEQNVSKNWLQKYR